jgi:hypothetical protein
MALTNMGHESRLHTLKIRGGTTPAIRTSRPSRQHCQQLPALQRANTSFQREVFLVCDCATSSFNLFKSRDDQTLNNPEYLDS